MVAVVGGAKVSTKLDLLGNLVTKVDHLVIGGGMANTFLVAQGIEVGKSLAERDMAPTAREILGKAKAAGCAIHLPLDIVVAREFKAGAASEVLDVGACPPDAMILDAGPATVATLREVFAAARTLIWNGPLGAFEIPPFDAATDGRGTRGGAADEGGQADLGRRAAAIRWRRCIRPGWRMISPSSRRPGVRSWNGWKARSCRAWRPCWPERGKSCAIAVC